MLHNQLSSCFWYAMVEVSLDYDMLMADPFDVDSLYMAGGEL